MNQMIHRQGPGSIAYAAITLIRKYSSEIMQDYFENVKELAGVQKDTIVSIGNLTKKAADDSAKKTRTQGWSSIAGGTVGCIASGASLYKMGGALNEMNQNTSAMQNIDDSIQGLNARPAGIQVGQVLGMELQEGQQGNIVTSLSEKDFTEGAFNQNRTIDVHVADDHVLNISETEAAQCLDNNHLDELRQRLNTKKETYKGRKETAESNLRYYMGWSQMAQPATSMISGIGQVYAAQYEESAGEASAEKEMASQVAQINASTEQMANSGADKSYQDMQAALQAYRQIVSANCRA